MANVQELRLAQAQQAVSSTDEDHLHELIACIATGNEGCFEQVYDQLAPYIYSLIWCIIRNRAHAEEVTQEVFLEIWQKAPTYDRTRGSARSWIAVIAHRRAIDRVRATQASYNRDLAQGSLDFQETYEHVHETVNATIEAENVAQALSALAPEHAEIITLAYYGGLSQRAIAESLDLPLGTVKSRMRAGLSSLRVTLKGGYGD